MNPQVVLGMVGLFLVAAALPHAMAQTDTNLDNVVINEVDINPPGDDAKTVVEWVELYNPTDFKIDIGGWKIASTTTLKKTFTITQNTVIRPGQFMTFAYQSLWFTDVSEVVQLRDAEGFVVDETPKLTDVKNDVRSWQRLYDGFDTDQPSDWKFEKSTTGNSNGILKIQAEDGRGSDLVSVATDQPSYLFGQSATISGKITKQVMIDYKKSEREQVRLTLEGPKYFQQVFLYPDRNNEFVTKFSLQKVLGFSDGRYDVLVEYAGGSARTQFTLGEQAVLEPELEEITLVMMTDRSSYLPGQTATITAKVSKIVPFEGLKFTVMNAKGVQIYDGTMFPVNPGDRSSVRGGKINADPNAQFSTTIFMNSNNPLPGTNQIIGEYASARAETTFELLADIKEDKLISLQTDKLVYGLGDPMIIIGRLNGFWIPSLDMSITRTDTTSLDADPTRLVRLKGGVRLEGDSSFRVDGQIPTSPTFIGDYMVKVSKNIGSATTFFKVVENPDLYVETTREPFTVTTDKLLYQSGEPIIISGKINEIRDSSSYQTPTVSLALKEEKGSLITSERNNKDKLRSVDQVEYSYTGIPDRSGNYIVKDTLYRNIYAPGSYTILAAYDDGRFKDATSFSVFDPLQVPDPGIITLNKEVFGLGEVVKLDGILSRPSQGSGIKITLHRPDGEIRNFGTLVENKQFSWSWTTPISEIIKHSNSNRATESASNLGIYRVNVGTDTGNIDVYFKVSKNPDTDPLKLEKPFSVTTDKPVYNAGEKLYVTGSVKQRDQGRQGLVVPDRVEIRVKADFHPWKQIYTAAVTPSQGGTFQTFFELPITVIKTGNYKVDAIYNLQRTAATFKVVNNLVPDTTGDGEALSLVVETDKKQYYPGETVRIQGKPTRVIHLTTVDLTVIKQSDTRITCGSFHCGTGTDKITVRISENGGLFSHQYKIPDRPDSIGKYEVLVNAEFGRVSTPFEVVEKVQQVIEEDAEHADEIDSPLATPEPSRLFGEKVFEKFNRITDQFVAITANEKTIGATPVKPKVIQASLFAPQRGEEGNVNLKVSTPEGTCVIGPDPECLVTGSTRGPRTIYQTVEIEGMEYKIRYSGPEVMLEKFTILPESADDVLPNSTWNIEVLKDTQSSRLYYQVSYVEVLFPLV